MDASIEDPRAVNGPAASSFKAMVSQRNGCRFLTICSPERPS